MIPTSSNYWILRYERGGTSGEGSRGRLASYKAQVINDFILDNDIAGLIDYGFGDCFITNLIEVDNYIGFDVSQLCVGRSRRLFPDKQFYLMGEYAGQTADLTISLDVIFHLIEPEVYQDYMHRLFNSSNKWVIIYSSDFSARWVQAIPHERRRSHTDWVHHHLAHWDLWKWIPNKYPNDTYSDFYIYKKVIDAKI